MLVFRDENVVPLADVRHQSVDVALHVAPSRVYRVVYVYVVRLHVISVAALRVWMNDAANLALYILIVVGTKNGFTQQPHSQASDRERPRKALKAECFQALLKRAEVTGL